MNAVEFELSWVCQKQVLFVRKTGILLEDLLEDLTKAIGVISLAHF